MTHDVTVHVLGATVYDVLKFMVAAFILEGLQKWLNKTGLSKSISGVVQLMVELLLLTFFAYTALQSHQSRGFDNGVLFATDCFLFLSLLIAVIYPLVKKYLPSGMKRIDWSDSNSWGTRASPIGRPVIASSLSKLLQFRAQFNGDGNKWAQMERWFPEVQDFSDWSGIRMRIKSDNLFPNSYIELQFMMSDNTTYTSRKVQIINQTVCFMFQQTSQSPWTPNQAVTFLNLHDIKCLVVACNTVCDDVNFSVGDFALIKSQICDREN